MSLQHCQLTNDSLYYKLWECEKKKLKIRFLITTRKQILCILVSDNIDAVGRNNNSITVKLIVLIVGFHSAISIQRSLSGQLSQLFPTTFHPKTSKLSVCGVNTLSNWFTWSSYPSCSILYFIFHPIVISWPLREHGTCPAIPILFYLL